jgi:hypothetical protein
LITKAHVDVNFAGPLKMTPLIYASIGGHLDLVKYLISEAKAEVHAKDYF